VNDVKARLEAIAQSQAQRLAKNLRGFGDVAAKLAASGTSAAARGRSLFEFKLGNLKYARFSPLTLTLIAAGAGAIVAFGVTLGLHFFDGASGEIAQVDNNIAALSRRVDSLERADNDALTQSRAALTTLGNRVAEAQSAISKSTTLTNSTLAEIQTAISAQPTARVPSSDETAAGLPDLGRLEQRLAALEAKSKSHAGPIGETAGLPADIGHGPGAFPPFESSNFAPLLIWLALSFGLLYLLMSKIGLPRVESILQTRAAKITKDLTDAHAFRGQSEAAAAAHDKTIADARTKAQTLAQDTQARLNAETDAKRHVLETDLNAKLAGAEAKILETKTKAMANVEAIATEAAAAIVQHITGKPANPKAIAAAVAEIKAKA
jgi:F-type H+-transporting ATPase subunit b